jgi:ribosomal protein S18 acetylase RimI-like enzyme
MTIRTATPADVPAVLGLWQRERSAAALMPDTEDALARAIETGALLVAQVDGRLAGTLIAGFDGWRGNLYRLVVEPEHRRRGIGSALVRHGEDRLRGLGAPRVTALVGVEEGEAAAFWAATGYAHDRRISRYVRNI